MLPSLGGMAGAQHCALKWELGTESAVNTLSFHPTAGGTQAELAAALDAQFTALMTESVVTTARVAEVAITPYDGVSATTAYPIVNWVGGVTGEHIPGVAVVLTLNTGLGGKSQRGRIYLPFTGEAMASNGVVLAADRAEIEAAWNTFVSAMGDAGWDLIVASTITQHTKTVKNPDGSVTRRVPNGGAVPHGTIVNHVKLQPVLGTQRRRQSRLR